MPPEEFRYWDLSSWREYVQKYVGDLYQSSRALLDLYERLQEKIKESDKGLIGLMLGGILEDGSYDKYSSGKLIRHLFGIYVDPKYWASISRLKDLVPENYIEVLKEESEFLDFLRKINELSEKILRKADLYSSEKFSLSMSVEDIVSDPEKLLDLIEKFLRSIMGFVANYNKYTFFVISVNHLPRFLIELLYPKIKDTFEDISSFLGLDVWQRLGENSKDLTLYRFPKDSIGGLIYSLNDLIWEKFNETPIKEVWEYAIDDVPELKKEYFKKSKEIIAKNWRPVFFPEIPFSLTVFGRVMCRLCREENRDIEYAYSFEYEIERGIIKGVLHRARYSSGSYTSVYHDTNVSLKAFFIDIAPLLFTKTLDIDFEGKRLVTFWNWLIN